MQSIINIKDQPCGSGKTTSMIEGFQQDRKYLVIVPELTEVDRVIEGSKLVLFQQPLAVVIEAKTAIAQAADRKRTVVVDLIGELAIQKAPPGYRNQ